MKQDFVQDSSLSFLCEQPGQGLCFYFEPGLRFCHPEATWRAATYHREEAGRAVGQIYAVSYEQLW